MTANLFGRKVFVDVVRLRQGHPGVEGPNSNDWHPYQERDLGKIWAQTDRRRGTVATWSPGRDCRGASVSRGMTGLAGGPQKLDEAGREHSSPRALQGSMPCPHLDFRLLAFRAMREPVSAVLSPHVWYFVWQLQESHTGSFTRWPHPRLASETGPHTVPLGSLLFLSCLSSCPPVLGDTPVLPTCPQRHICPPYLSSETHLSSCLPILLPTCPLRHTWILSSSRKP